MSNPLTQRNLIALNEVVAAICHDSLFWSVTKSTCIPALQNLPLVLRSKIFDGNRDWIVDFGLTSDFPDEPPVVVVKGADRLFLKNPHVFENGQLCIFPNHSALDSQDPIGLIKYARAQARAILKGTTSQDFQTEFSSYWSRKVSKDALDVLIIDPVERLGKTFPVAFLQGMICIAASSESLSNWATNRLGKSSELCADKLGIRLDLAEPIIPDHYPETLHDLIEIARKYDPEASKALVKHVYQERGKALVLLAQRERDGLALGGIQFSGMELKSRNHKGYRPGKAPQELILKGAANDLRAAAVVRSNVKRVDSLWIHSRGGDGRDLSQKSVLLIGCGSLGGYIAHLLSRAGIGRLVMTDNDKLEWSNLGRHILGANSVGQWKAQALAQSIAAELPHLKVGSS